MTSALINLVVVFTFVLARVGAMVMTAPLFGSGEIPVRLRLLFAVILALVIMPLHWGVPPAIPADLAQCAVGLGGELLVGALLGTGVMILLSGAQVAGQIISQMSGLSLADVFNPDLDQEVSVIANLLNMTTLAVFVVIGGHRLLIGAVLDTYRYVPLGRVEIPPSLGALISTLVAESFSLAVRGAAPAMVALLLATVVLGLVSRTLPQLNVMTTGFGLNAAVSMVALAASIGAVAWLFQNQLESAVQAIVESLHPSV